MKSVIYLVPETCLECRYFEKFEYLPDGLSKPIEVPDGAKTAKVVVKLKPDGTKKYIARCGVYGGLIRVGGEITKTYRLSMFSDEKECTKEFSMDECTLEQIKSAKP
jgi:hypothetical protein